MKIGTLQGCVLGRKKEAYNSYINAKEYFEKKLKESKELFMLLFLPDLLTIYNNLSIVEENPNMKINYLDKVPPSQR